MTSFRTEIKIPKSNFKIRHTDTLFSIGSCFSENIHLKLKSHLFESYCNPCGIVYNPYSIAHQMIQIINEKNWNENDLILHEGLIHGIHHHGDYSGIDKISVLDKMNAERSTASLILKNSDTILITLGTSIVYHLIDRHMILANNHKLSADGLQRKMMDVEEIVDHTFSWIKAMINLKPDIHFIFTLSPVRYLKEGFSDNTKSKARLALAIESLCSTFSNIHYFPSYEIVLDDLRDYRFYKDDRVHPSHEAVEYIWSKFCETYFDQDTNNLLEKINQILKSKNHRALHPDSMAHRKFVAKLEMEIIELKMKYPYLKI